MSARTSLLERTDERLRSTLGAFAWPLTLVGAVVLAVSTFLPWTFDSSFSADLTVAAYPAGPQVFVLVLAALAVLLLVLYRLRPARPGSTGAVRGAAAFAVAVMLSTAIAIMATLGGLANLDVGAWLGIVGALVLLVGSRGLPADTTPSLRRRLPDAVEILTVVALLGVGLWAAAYALNTDDSTVFITFLLLVSGLLLVLHRLGILTWISDAAGRHRVVTIGGAFITTALFPFTQGGSDANMSIATQVLIFAATAMGLNIVVGLAGLLDLGYIAFLGVGAYTAAALSTSAFATIDWHPPFFVVAALGAGMAALAGLIIGTPTLRVSGDYLAIVTLAFGEIFRITMNNLDGTDGPDLTNGPNGIPAIPDLGFFGFDFGARHELLGITLGRFTNYFYALLVLLAFVILVFTRLNNSRIGRGWVAIREDEIAAEAMGVNTFRLKLLAFAGGAFLAGLAGTIKAHHDVSVTPDQYQFLESAFLLAAIVLGGMGTVLGVLLGATILELLPEKLRFFNEYRLLIFGAVLIIMMRFRPEGLIASQRRQLEFHEEDEALARELDESVARITAGEGPHR